MEEDMDTLVPKKRRPLNECKFCERRSIAECNKCARDVDGNDSPLTIHFSTVSDLIQSKNDQRDHTNASC